MAKQFRYPQSGALMRHYTQGDFLDSQIAPLPDPTLTAADLAVLTFFAMPRWVMTLLGVRDALVRPLGLKTGKSEGFALPTREDLLSGRYDGVFAVQSVTADEVMLGIDDRHLDFRVAILKTVAPRDHVAISTWVHPHNFGGWLYLWAVYPFHKLIVWRMLANIRDATGEEFQTKG